MPSPSALGVGEPDMPPPRGTSRPGQRTVSRGFSFAPWMPKLRWT